MWSTAALAADAADEAPRASMIAAPRLATVGMNVRVDPLVVADRLVGVLPADLGVEQVGVLRRRVVAPDRHLLHVGDRRAELLGDLADRPVVVEAGHRREADRGRGPLALDWAIRALVLAGLPTTSTLTSRAGAARQRLALRLEDAAVGRQQVGALHPLLARHRPDEQGDVDVAERHVGVVGAHDVGEQREGAVVELHPHALERAERRRDLEQLQGDRGVRAEHRTRGDAEQQAVADLAGGPGDGDTDRGAGCHGAERRPRSERRRILAPAPTLRCRADRRSAGCSSPGRSGGGGCRRRRSSCRGTGRRGRPSRGPRRSGTAPAGRPAWRCSPAMHVRGALERQDEHARHAGERGEELGDRLVAERAVRAEVDDDGVAELPGVAQALHHRDHRLHLPADLGVDDDALGRQLVGGAEHHRVADGEEAAGAAAAPSWSGRRSSAAPSAASTTAVSPGGRDVGRRRGRCSSARVGRRHVGGRRWRRGRRGRSPRPLPRPATGRSRSA